MGCVSSKKIRCDSPPYDDVCSTSCIGGSRRQRSRLRPQQPPLHNIKEEPEAVVVVVAEEEGPREPERKRRDREDTSELKRGASQKKPVLQYGRLSTESELVAAGWPSWLTAVAADAIDGWVPLKADAYERLDKIGQGTYSNVYRARDLKTNKIVAVKKVRFDNFQAESVRFMAREIMILRMLDHPNVMKLEGIITSRLSCTIYLVFEYMEHDLAGLLSCPDVSFTESQIKCYMRQLLSGLDHCHSRGIMHRDIKSSNILVNNEGVLKIADFGLAYFTRPKSREPLTSRVVTLWYRPPELLLGSTNYGGEVDLWSVGCVFAELFMGRPILKGRTEVEQLHKIFKLCGTPADDYWTSSKLPLAHMFRPQQSYQTTLHERCRDFPKSAVALIETFLSFEPHKRGTASSALASKYFHTKPYACDPLSLPKYPPNKEMDAKYREDAKRRKAGATSRLPRKIRNLEGSSEESEGRRHGMSGRRRSGRTSLQYDTMSEASRMTQESQTSHISTTKSVPIQPSTTDFVWSVRGTHDHYRNSTRQIYPNHFQPLEHSVSSRDYEAQGFSAVSQSTI